jgi:peptide-methionine (R)-S-oxide reductase
MDDERTETGEKVEHDDATWREKLDPMAYAVLREEATERAFTGALWDEKREGLYRCGGCGAALFDSETKYESGSGWPSFYRPRDGAPVGERVDRRLFMKRTEVHCERCGGHLGHVFDDGPRPTGLRYCLNSAALCFEPEGDQDAE